MAHMGFYGAHEESDQMPRETKEQKERTPFPEGSWVRKHEVLDTSSSWLEQPHMSTE